MAAPTDEIEIIGTSYINWGYLNCCQIVYKGKKVKKEKWATYWFELCGLTLKFFEDKSLHIESNLLPPPSDEKCMLKENEGKVMSINIDDSECKTISTETFNKIFHSKSRKNVSQNVFRRHLFKLKLQKSRATYILQAPSSTTMLKWISKVQESLDADEPSQKKSFPVERLKSVKKVLVKKSNALYDVIEADDDTISLMSLAFNNNHIHPALRELRRELKEKQDRLWQYEMQMIDFLGRGKGEFLRYEFKCNTKHDYLLIPSRIETFLPAGTKVTIFGQLPNKRWRCIVEINELKDSLRTLINTTREKKQAEDLFIPKNKMNWARDIDTLENLFHSIPDYPLIGCLPTSALDLHNKKPSERQKRYIVTVKSSSFAHPSRSPSPQTPPTDRRSSEFKTPPIQRKHIDVQTPPIDSVDQETLRSEGFPLTPFLSKNSLLNTEESDVTPVQSESDEESDDDIPEMIKKVKLRNFGKGIVIRKQLRQKGISIIVGSSSSEGEEM